MARIGFEVPQWQDKPLKEFTPEQLLEYWHKLRLVSKTGSVDTSDYSRKGLSTDLYICMLQHELLDRMGGQRND